MTTPPHLRRTLAAGSFLALVWLGVMPATYAAAQQPDCGTECASWGTGETYEPPSSWPPVPELPPLPDPPLQDLPPLPALPPQQIPPQELPPQQLPPQELPAQQLPPEDLPAKDVPAQQSPAKRLPSSEPDSGRTADRPGVAIPEPALPSPDGSDVLPPPADAARNQVPETAATAPPPASEVVPAPPPETTDVQTKAVVTDLRTWLLFAAALAATFAMVRGARAFQQYRSRREHFPRLETRLDTSPFVVEAPKDPPETRSVHLELRTSNHEEES